MSETSVRRKYWRRYFLVFICFLGAMTLLSYMYGRGFFGPRGLGISLLLLIIGVIAVLTLVVRKYGKDLRAATPPPGTPIKEATRKQRLRYIRDAKIGIVVLALCLAYGLSQSQFQRLPVGERLVGVLINLTLIATLVGMVVRLKKSLK